MRILHVTECYEGGVRRAIDAIVRITPELDHFLLADEAHLQDVGLGYSEVFPMSKGFRARHGQVRAVVEHVDADLVHAHSSWAGAYARVSTPIKPVVYEPHCFVFDDPHRGWLQKWIYRRAENALGKNTAAVIALTPHEQALASGVMPHEKIVWLPNVPSIPVSLARQELHAGVPEIVMVGRLARQKDPSFFASLFKSLKDKGIVTKFTWIGDGEASYSTLLTDEGVEVTGWLNDADLAQKLSQATLYFHSASYEGFPLSVLDAAAARLPILARDLPCFKGFPVNTATSVEDAANKIQAYLTDPHTQKNYTAKTDELLSMMNPEAQRASLYQAYEMATGTRKETPNCV